MAEPEHSSMHNFAYHPSVANWVQSTALAHLDGASDDVAEQSPDDFYKSTPSHMSNSDPSHPAADMTTTRQRQQAPNGAARSTPKPSVRSVSASAVSTTSTSRSGPQVPSNRPTVRSLAQKFNQPSSTESSPIVPRTRAARPSQPSQTATGSSPARPAKEASYGTYKFNHLKPRERPQPAPPSPAHTRRTNGSRSSLPSVDQQSTPTRRKLSSPTRGTGRQPFFGEVVGEHNPSTPGFGIPVLESSASSIGSPAAETSTIKLVTEELQPLPEHPHPESLSPSQRLPAVDRTIGSPQSVEDGASSQQSPVSDTRTPRRRSPPSRIPVASRRLSATSDSGSSTRSANANAPWRPVRGHTRASPTRRSRVPVGSKAATSPKRSKAPSQPTLPATSYRGYRERGKSSQGVNSGPSVAAVITHPLPPTSPRLRNSRERQKLQESPSSRSRSADPSAPHDYFGNGATSAAQPQSRTPGEENREDRPSVKLVEPSPANNDPVLEMNSHTPSTSSARHRALSLTTEGLQAPPLGRPESTATSFDYEESPVLGMPGSFMMTPPIAQSTSPLVTESAEAQRSPPKPVASEGELLQARTFQPNNKERSPQFHGPNDAEELPSELGLRESIPIMLGSDGPAGWEASPTRPPMHSSRLSIGSQTWRVEPLDATGTISYLEEDDSPIDPFSHRETLRPDDSASVAFYRQAGQRSPSWMPQVPDGQDAGSFTLDSEAYSVINKVLNMYHESDTITPELARDSRTQVQGVSPIIAQHKDWGSKEATETYLARLLSDAAGTERRTNIPDLSIPEQHNAAPKLPQPRVPALSIGELDADPDEPVAGGTAIIFPSESRRYSRGSAGSAATTIWEGPSRPDSSSGLSTRERRPGSNGNATLAQVTYPSTKDWSVSRKVIPTQLPEIEGAGEGLGLSLEHHAHEPLQASSYPITPPRPAYSPPPPPLEKEPMVSRVFGPGGDDFTTLGSNDESRVSASSDEHPAHGPPRSPKVDPEATPTAALQVRPASGGVPERAPTIVPVADDQSNPEGPPSDQQPQVDEKTKWVQKRYRVIEELTKTEHSFCVDMMVAHQIFEGTSREVLSDQERRLLFCNCKDLENFSHGLWKSLKEAIKPIVNQTPPAENSEEPYDEFLCCTPENDRLVKVGAIIKAATNRMERVYTTYYLNYGDASDFIKKNANNPELLGWVMACFQHCPNLTSAWDLDSLLIKPVQRMLRYPLLLDDLIKQTPADHPDLPDLKAANETIRQIAARIELAKKRQQTLRAATSEGKKEKNKGRLGKTIVKAFISNKDRAKTLQEASQIFEDREYNQVTQKFGGHFFQIQIVIRDFDQYLDAISEQMGQLNSVMLGFINVSEAGPSANPEMESTWRRWAMAYIELQNKVLEEHRTSVRNRVMKPICEVWDQWVSPQKLMEQRKKALLQYAKYKQCVDRKEKVDAKLEEAAKDFMTINDSLKQELPKLYELTKNCIRLCEIIFLGIQKDWYKTCSKKILPLLESEPQHTTSITYDFKVYVDRFKSDFRQMEERAKNMAIVNHDLMANAANFMSPNPTFYSDDASSRKSSSRRTESMGSDLSMLDHRNRNRNSGGYGNNRSGMHSFDGPPRSSPAAPHAGPPTSYHMPASAPTSAGLPHTRERGATSPYSPPSDATITQRSSAGRPSAPWASLDGAFDYNYDTYAIPASMGASFLNPPPNASNPNLTPTTTNTTSSNPNSSRTSGVFNSALPMAELGRSSMGEDQPPTPNADMDEPEVLFLAASLFEFNIAHDRREGGIPYLVYVPGEIFDVIGMKGELWLARNQDDPTRTVGWIWEKHFARILPEDA